MAITGATSATALWIASAFSKAGWQVHSLCSLSEKDYSDQRKERLRWLREFSQVHFELRSAHAKIQWVKCYNPDIFVFHHHHMEQYRQPGFDHRKAVLDGVEKAAELIFELKRGSCRGLLYSASYFELNGSTSPYTQSKVQVGTFLKESALVHELPFSKIYVPDAFGPFENEDRFIPLVLRAARLGIPFELKNPTYVGNHMTMHELAEVYVTAATAILEGERVDFFPRGWIGSQKEWLSEIEAFLLQPLGLCYRREVSPASNSFHQKVDWTPYIHFETHKNPWRGL